MIGLTDFLLRLGCPGRTVSPWGRRPGEDPQPPPLEKSLLEAPRIRVSRTQHFDISLWWAMNPEDWELRVYGANDIS